MDDRQYAEYAADLREREATPAEQVHDELDALIKRLKSVRPAERSEVSRRYAIVITELEKALAYLQYYIILEE